VLNDLLRKDIERYGELKLTQKGLEFKEKPYSIKVAYDRDFSENEDEFAEDFVPISSAESTTDPELYNLLKSIRKRIAEKEKLLQDKLSSIQSLQNEVDSLQVR
jgi:ATP-dependent DNA helicase RecQ